MSEHLSFLITILVVSFWPFQIGICYHISSPIDSEENWNKEIGNLYVILDES